MILNNRLNKISSNKPSICGADCIIDDSDSFFGNVIIGQGCYIGRNVIIGQESIDDIRNKQESLINASNGVNSKTIIGNQVIIQPNVVISNNVTIGNNVSIGPFVTIGKNSTIGNGTEIMYRAQIFENNKIGEYCKIGGFLCDFCTIGNSVTIMGNLIHSYRNGWIEDEDLEYESPLIEDNVIVGFNSLVIGKVRIKSGTYIAAGAIVTKDTPGNCFIKSVNQLIYLEEYNGRLKNGKFFQDVKKNGFH